MTAETRAKVESAIADLGYRPNAIARDMAKGRTRAVACLSPNLTDYTFACLIEGAETEARRHGYLMLSSSAQNEAAFGSLVEQLVASQRTEGLMVINPYADGRHTLLPPNFPTVFVGARPRAEAADSVALDDEAAAGLATQHLIDLGHRRIALISGPSAEDCTQDRNAGYEATLRKASIAYDPEMVVEGDWSATSGHHAFTRLAQLPDPPTAIFAQNDRMAIGVLRAARDLGLQVPDQLSVIGLDDMPLASYVDPPLTTIRQDMFGIGRAAIRLLIRAIDQPDAPREHLRVPAELIVRHSTGPGPANKGGSQLTRN